MRYCLWAVGTAECAALLVVGGCSCLEQFPGQLRVKKTVSFAYPRQ